MWSILVHDQKHLDDTNVIKVTTKKFLINGQKGSSYSQGTF